MRVNLIVFKRPLFTETVDVVEMIVGRVILTRWSLPLCMGPEHSWTILTP